MKEDFLHYLWRYKKFDSTKLISSNGEEITIVNSGQYLRLAGPDFFNAQMIIGSQKWAGNVELHLRSSDWYRHSHETDEAYENVILHVVWQHDAPVFRKDGSEIPVLEICNYVSADTIQSYESLSAAKSWIYCERQLASVEGFVVRSWLERLYFERLENKSAPIHELLSANGGDWEATLFCMLASGFGLNTNRENFMEIAKTIPFDVIRKSASGQNHLEALLLGQAGLLETVVDAHGMALRQDYLFLVYKHNLSRPEISVDFFRHRPDNFPTIRLAQLATLYQLKTNIFSKVVETDSVAAYYELFSFDVSGYWQTHYHFARENPKRSRGLTKAFVDLLLLNSIIPARFAYARSIGADFSEDLLSLAESIAAEKNSVTEGFSSFGLQPQSAFESQAMLELKKKYCDHSRCLSCAIGLELLKPQAEKTS